MSQFAKITNAGSTEEGESCVLDEIVAMHPSDHFHLVSLLQRLQASPAVGGTPANLTYIAHVENYHQAPQSQLVDESTDNQEQLAELHRAACELKAATSQMRQHIEDIAKELRG